ncbi:MAG: hypothetical protein LBS01_09665 [Prevotellaceae bacterium]|jgi:tetratricopeptide (TPR) repeat protein|nr:hypothetical protein [Prevotellaceae bacterium]
MKKIFITAIITGCAHLMFAQNLVSEAETLFNSGRYFAAAAVYETLLAQKPSDPLNNYRLARCYFEAGDLERSVPLFNLAKAKYIASNYYLGIYHHKLYYFQEAIAAFETYLSAATDPVFIAKAEKLLQQATLAAEMLNRVEDIALIDSITVNKKDFLSAYRIAPDMGTLTQTTENSRRQLFDNVRYTTQRGDRSIFSALKGEQSDILTSYLLADKWSEPVSVSAGINTAANENYPFLMPDGITLYFASDGDKSIGGYDIFTTRFNSSKNDFYIPENIGMPFNSPANDYMMVIDEVHGIGWFASDRFQSDDKVTVYRFMQNREKKIVRSESPEYLRNYAQLKTFRKATNVPQINAANNFSEHKPQYADFEFVINNHTVYRKLSDFKSKEAMQLCQTFEKDKVALNQLKENLESLRNQYSISANTEKQQIAHKILELEKNIPEKETSLDNLQQQIRSLEITKLRE